MTAIEYLTAALSDIWHFILRTFHILAAGFRQYLSPAMDLRTYGSRNGIPFHSVIYIFQPT